MSHTRHQLPSRRRFLALCGSSIAASTLTRSSWAAPATPPAGIQLYMVKDDLAKNPAATLQRLAQIGYREVETAGFADLKVAEFRKLLEAANLRAPSAHLFFGIGDTAKLLDDAKALGAHYAVSSILPPRPPTGQGFASILTMLNSMTSDDFKQVAALANSIAQQAKAAGLQYAYHNHNFEFRDLGNGQTGYEILLRETDPALVKFEADCGWMIAGGANPAHYFQKYPGRYVMIHVKDFTHVGKPSTTLAAPDGPKSTELGRGGIDYKPIIAAARAAGVEHFFVEQEPPFVEMPPLEAAKVNFDALHTLLRQS